MGRDLEGEIGEINFWANYLLERQFPAPLVHNSKFVNFMLINSVYNFMQAA